MHVWRERLHQWFLPLATRCPLSPNAITMIALGLSLIAAATFYAASRQPWLFLGGMAVVILAGLADAFDGIVARVQHRESLYGDFLDHFADRVADTMLAAGWMLGNGVRKELAIGGIVAIMHNPLCSSRGHDGAAAALPPLLQRQRNDHHRQQKRAHDHQLFHRRAFAHRSVEDRIGAIREDDV